MYNSLASTNGLNLSFSTTYKLAKEELQKNTEAMDSNLPHKQMNSSLMRYRSLPSSRLSNFIDGGDEGCDGFLPRSSSPEAERLFARFISGTGEDSASRDVREIGEKLIVNQRSPQFMEAIEHETEVVPQQNRFPSASPMIYQTEQRPNHRSATGSAIDSSYRVVNSMAMDSSQVKSSSNSSNLIRHSSSPAGLFSHLTVEKGYDVVRDMGNFRVGNGSNGEAASTIRLRNQTNFLSRQGSSPGLLSQISEIGTENITVSSPEDGSLGNANSSSRCYIPGYPISSWDDSPLGENSAGFKRLRDDGELGNHTSGLSHQFSFPKTSLEMATMEEFLQFQDSVPCKIRAKRGCATHPRSIAERVRRTRISERMRKLQELVPNMDKQTNTADMLDLAVVYIKDLQKQVKTLSDDRESCTCSSKQKPHPTPAV